MKNRKHYVRRRKSINPLLCADGEIHMCWVYDFFTACGVYSLLNSTPIKKYVTCKNCKRTKLFRGVKK